MDRYYFAKGVPAHASMPELGVNAAGVTFECMEKAGFEDDFVNFIMNISERPVMALV